MNLSTSTKYELDQLANADDAGIARAARNVLAAGTREALRSSTGLEDLLLAASRDEDYQRDVRADFGFATSPTE